LKQYFPLDVVINGLFSLVREIFKIHIKQVDTSTVPVWHKDVRFYLIYNNESDDTPIAGFFVDPYTRPSEKKSGAWMDICTSRLLDKNTKAVKQIPIAYLICNSGAPVDNQPSVLTFDDVETLFHEFGHGLQHMLTTVPYLEASGLSNIEWDAVELPSQFMENWCYHKPTLLSLSSHVKTGEKLPDDLLLKLQASRTFRAASLLLRQLSFGLLDLELYTSFDPSKHSQLEYYNLQKEVLKKTELLPVTDDDLGHTCAFSHIFSGEYACGYYSYKWAEVLSADAFYAFVEAGLDNPSEIQKVGQKFRENILARGGSEHPMDIFIDFRGRKPDPDSLLKLAGIIK